MAAAARNRKPFARPGNMAALAHQLILDNWNTSRYRHDYDRRDSPHDGAVPPQNATSLSRDSSGLFEKHLGIRSRQKNSGGCAGCLFGGEEILSARSSCGMP